MSESETAKHVAREVRVWMLRKDVSQQTLMAALGLSQSSVSRRLTGEIPFDLDELEKVAALFGVPTATLLGGGEVGAA